MDDEERDKLDKETDEFRKERRRAASNIGVVCAAAAIVGAFTGESGWLESIALMAIGVVIIFWSTKP